MHDCTGLKEILVICGPNDVGRSTIAKFLVKELPGLFSLGVYSTWLPWCHNRPVLVHKYEYDFQDMGDLKTKAQDGDFIYYYATEGTLSDFTPQAIETVLSAGKRCIITLGVDDCQLIDKLFTGRVTKIFIHPPDRDVLCDELFTACSDTVEVSNALMKQIQAIDFETNNPGFFDAVWTNKVLEDTQTSILKFVKV